MRTAIKFKTTEKRRYPGIKDFVENHLKIAAKAIVKNETDDRQVIHRDIKSLVESSFRAIALELRNTIELMMRLIETLI